MHESSKKISLEMIDKLRSTPHDPTGAMRAEPREVEQVKPRDVATAVDDGESPQQPRRMRISQASIEKLGGSAIAAGDPGYKTVGHTSACRAGIEGLARDDAELRDRLSVADERRLKFRAEYIEKKSRKQQEVASDSQGPQERPNAQIN